MQLGKRRRVATAERCEKRFGGKSGRLTRFVETRRDRIPRLGSRPTAPARSISGRTTARADGSAVHDALRRGAIPRLYGGAKLVEGSGHFRIGAHVCLVGSRNLDDLIKKKGKVPTHVQVIREFADPTINNSL